MKHLHKNLLFTLMAILAMTIVSSCKHDATTHITDKGRATRELDLNEFVCVQASSSIDIYYTQGPDSKIKIDAPKHLIDYVVATVERGVLIITFDTKGESVQLSPEDTIDINVSGPHANGFYSKSSGNIIIENDIKEDGKIEFESSSSGDIKVIGTVSCNELVAEAQSSGDVGVHVARCTDMHLKATSSGDIRIKDCQTRNITAESASSGDISIYGYTIHATLNAKSSGDIFCRDLLCKTVKASATSNGEIRCNASESATIESSGHGYVYLYGNPQNLDTSKAIRFKVL